MRTLLFCTAYAESEEIWKTRYLTWYNHYRKASLQVSSLQILDDGSPTQPDFLTDNEYFRFSDRLGRQAYLVYPGWYRSFSFGIIQAIRKGYDKIIHCESDAFVLSGRATEFINSLESGWHTFWCPKHEWPESAIQVICKDQFEKATNFLNVPYSTYVGSLMDKELPYTEVHKEFIGDRYGETNQEIPIDADFSCQTSLAMLEKWKYAKTLF